MTTKDRIISVRVLPTLGGRLDRLASRRGWDVSTLVRDLVARATSTVDLDAPVTCTAPLSEFEVRWMPDHSCVAGEPEATTKEASEAPQISAKPTPTPTHVDTVSGPAAADLSGGVGGLGEATRDEFVHLTNLIAERHAHAIRLGAAVLAHAILDAGYRRAEADSG
jgi:hypothetical protein